MNNEEYQQVIALSVILQAIANLKQLAFKGSFNREETKTVLKGLVNYNTADVQSAYTDTMNDLKKGLETVKALLLDNHDRDFVVYLMSVINIEKKLITDDVIHRQLQNKVQDYSDQKTLEKNENLLDKDAIEDFAELYKNTASTLSPRIMVKGTPEYLNIPENASMIRALLLAALRGASFFRQNGGSRVSLATKRKNYLAIAESYLN